MILKTERLIISELTRENAPFFFELVNDPAWIKYIGDKEINTISDAKDAAMALEPLAGKYSSILFIAFNGQSPLMSFLSSEF